MKSAEIEVAGDDGGGLLVALGDEVVETLVGGRAHGCLRPKYSFGCSSAATTEESTPPESTQPGGLESITVRVPPPLVSGRIPGLPGTSPSMYPRPAM